MDITVVIIFENLFMLLKKEIEHCATDHVEFWSHLDAQVVDMNELLKLGLSIINNSKVINDIWAQMMVINPNYHKALTLYGTYLEQIKNDIVEGEEL